MAQGEYYSSEGSWGGSHRPWLEVRCSWLVCGTRPQGEGEGSGRPGSGCPDRRAEAPGAWLAVPKEVPEEGGGSLFCCFWGQVAPGGGVCAEHRILNIVYFFYIAILCCRFM